jgi:hypothetical protein
MAHKQSAGLVAKMIHEQSLTCGEQFAPAMMQTLRTGNKNAMRWPHD